MMRQIVKSLIWSLTVFLGAVAAHAAQVDVPYVPTPQVIVDRMLDMAKVTSRDYLIDLGSGDGRIVVTAAKKFGTRGFGVDLNPERVREAVENARTAGVSDKVAFYQRNLFDTDLSEATVITMYLLPRVNLELRPRLLALKPGTRLVSHDFDMDDWKADQSIRINTNDKFFGSGGDSDIYFWVVPAKVAGAWQIRMSVSGKERTYLINLTQKFQQISGTASVEGRSVPLRDARLRGAELSFAFTTDVGGSSVSHDFRGRVDAHRAVGEARLSGNRVAAQVEWAGERRTADAGSAGTAK